MDLPSAERRPALRSALYGIEGCGRHQPRHGAASLHSHNITTVEQLCKLSSKVHTAENLGQRAGRNHVVLAAWGDIEGKTKRITKEHWETTRSCPEIPDKEKAYLVGLKLPNNAAAKLRRRNMWARESASRRFHSSISRTREW